MLSVLERFERVSAERAQALRECVSGSRGLRSALERAVSEGRPGLILEFKRCSPRGFIAYMTPDEFLERIGVYADAVSVLTEPYWFCGSVELIPFFARARPVLAKDFVVAEEQVEVYSCMGASGVLLILDMLGWSRLEKLYEAARAHGLDALIETSNWRDAVEAAGSYPEALIGLNARDLRNLRVDFDRLVEEVSRVHERVGSSTLIVAESGVDSVEKARRVVEAGARAILVGTWVMREPGAAEKLRSLRLS